MFCIFESGEKELIQLKNVEKIYQTEHGSVHALNDVSLEINEGEIFGIIGYSGAGKSTLIRLINLLEKPTSGTISIGDRQLTDLSDRQLREERRTIGMIFQHFNLLWSRTVAENIAFPLELTKIKKKQKEKRIADLIRMVGLEGKESAYPSQLSGGQKQRVGIARALANNPRVLLCDEATSALDPKTTDSILSLLLEINKSLGLTIVLITHEMSVIQKICSKVAVLDKGKIVEEGVVNDVFAHPKQPITQEFVGAHAANKVKHSGDTLAISGWTRVRIRSVDARLIQRHLSSLFGREHLLVRVLETYAVQDGSAEETIVAIQGPAEEIDSALSGVKSDGLETEVIHAYV